MSAEIIREYFSMVEAVHKTGVATEHSYRASLEWLFDKIETGVTAVNEPKGVKVGRPDFVFQRGTDQITVGHCEAKDINLDVSPKAMDKGNRAQFDRYVKGLPNLIYTNCLDFHFYKEGELVREIKIADYLMGLQADESQFEPLWNQLKDFAAERLQTITSAERLAEVMAGKAAIIKDVLFNSLSEDEELHSELAGQFKAFKAQLIHDLEIEGFSDIYAETIAYGLFAARLHDEDLETFSRAEALEKLPKSNPFLRRLFEFVAGPGLDDAIKRTIDELAEIFQAVDLGKLFANFGSFTQRNDPFIHFYETFLAKYNPAKRKARGVWYTPEPVVNFIVRAVDDVLKEEFGLADGLADTSKIDVTYEEPHPDKPGKWRKKTEAMHRVQILDPAAGTGTFLAEVIKQISGKIKAVAPGQLPSYIENDLIPRLHGFELLMASYAMCHMKLDMMLTSLGYKPTQEPPRLGVYLTNSLEEGAREVPDLLMTRWLSEEARLANDVKRDKPIMCVIGNPPYSGISQNMGDWIVNLIEDYKYVDGKHFGERKHWLHDDYVKFIRLAEHMIEKNGEGILGFITNHGYLDNPTFRGMRWHLLKTFDKIYVLDLHGNAKKKEVSPDGSPDKNVFDIQQGVALIIAVKRKEKSDKLAQVFHGDLWGSRKNKYKALETNTISSVSNKKLPNQKPQYPFVKRNFELEKTYLYGFGVDKLMQTYGSGIVTMGDGFAISQNLEEFKDRINYFKTFSGKEIDFKSKFNLGKNYSKWIFENKHRILQSEIPPCKVSYRPFDEKVTAFDRNIIWRLREKCMRNYFEKNNCGLITSKAFKDSKFAHAFVSNNVTEAILLSGTTGSNAMNFPLYIYPDPNNPSYTDDGKLDQSIRVNMDAKICEQIEAAAMGNTGGKPHPEPVEGRGDGSGNTPALRQAQGEGVIDIQPTKDADGRPNEVAIFDYIYGVLHCPQYRETYKEFLKIDFPRIPYPPSPEVFWDVSEKGTQLRRLHLMEEEAIGETPYIFEGEGTSEVDKVQFEATSSSTHPEPVEGMEDKAGTLRQAQGEALSGSVFINETQSFSNVPKIAWEFFIGGYQPAQKWLKDRKGRTLSFDDIRHYQKIIKILSETDRIMKEIELPLD